jgi:hypothetical protein
LTGHAALGGLAPGGCQLKNILDMVCFRLLTFALCAMLRLYWDIGRSRGEGISV